MYDKSFVFKGQKKIILYTTSLTYKSRFGERIGKRVLRQLFPSSVLSKFLNIITFKIKEGGEKKHANWCGEAIGEGKTKYQVRSTRASVEGGGVPVTSPGLVNRLE